MVRGDKVNLAYFTDFVYYWLD